ncbi:MAG: exodeoxyribonuclease III [Planctomycetota bacterium]
MRIASWNVNGIRALHRKGIAPLAAVSDAAVVCLQETKAHPEQVPPAVVEPEGWHGFWHPAQRRGYSGVTTFTRDAPDEVVTGMGAAHFDDEGRVLSVRFGELVIVNAYFPNSQPGGARLDYKLAFCTAMEDHLAGWRDRGHRTVLVGDYNIAHRPIDLARPGANEHNPGYLPEERAWFSRYLELGYRDVFRERNPGLAAAYTWWSYRSGARARNIGWRIDYATVSPDLVGDLSDVAIHPEVAGSDHCPVSIAFPG